MTSQQPPAVGRLTLLAQASTSAPVVGAAKSGDEIYVVTRSTSPTRVGCFNLRTRRARTVVELPHGDGGWGAVVSEGHLYVGTYPTAHFYDIDLSGEKIVQRSEISGEGYVWHLTTAPDGQIVGGTYPGATVFTYEPRTGEVTSLGRIAPDDEYIRCVAADDRYVYAGTAVRAHLYRVDRHTHQTDDILPPELAGESFVCAIATFDDKVVIGTEPGGVLAVISLVNPSEYQLFHTGQKTVDSVFVDGAKIYFTTRSSGALYVCDYPSGTLRQLAVPVSEDETRLLCADGAAIVGVAASGAIWHYEPDAGPPEVNDLIASGFPAAPELIHSMAAEDGRVYVGGHFRLQVHDIERGTSEAIRVPGETKAIAVVDKLVFTAGYPTACIGVFDPATSEYRTLVHIGHRQNRPRDMHYDTTTGLILVASGPEYGYRTGALSTFDPTTSEITTFTDVVPGQSVASVSSWDGLAFLGGETNALGFAADDAPSLLVAVDIRSGDIRWQSVPVSGARRITSLTVVNATLFGATSGGEVFSVDTFSGEVLRHRRLSTSSVRLAVYGERLLAVDSESARELSLDLSESREIVRGLGDNLGAARQLAVDASGDAVYTLAGGRIARIEHQPLR